MVVGHKVPAGTGLREYNDIIVGSKRDMDVGEAEVAQVFEALGGEGDESFSPAE